MFRRSAFTPTPEDVRSSVTAASRLWSGLGEAKVELPFEELVAAHTRIHAAAEELSGTTLDCQKRAVTYYSIYADSEGNFMFPLIASHGSMWGVTHTSRIGRALRPLLRLSRHGRVQGWLDALDAIRDINRRVFVEVYTTFYFTRFYGTHARANEVIKPDVLALYNQVHAAIASGEKLSLETRRQIYADVFIHEQNDIVDPGIQQAVSTCPSVLVALFQRVRPRFTYFPKGESLVFTDFTDVEQRNAQGLRAMDFAEQVGDARVLEALSEY